MAKNYTFADKFDQRILSMSFDNADFERNMEQSMKTLESFDESLNKLDSKSFDAITKAAKNVDLSGIASAAYAVERSFSAMEIVGLTVIQNLTNAAINFGRGLWANTFGQIKSGGLKRALNIEQATFLLEGLKLDVQQIKEDAMFAVEGTAYGFDEAAKAAASFGASGVKAGEDMKQALLGVSGVAAMTGRDYENISSIFTTIASNGRVMTEQIRQFSYAGLNISAVLGEQLGKTEAEINDLVSKGKISFNTFAKAMNDAFGEHAKDANKTFSGAMANMKAALSRIGEAFATPYIENMIPVFNKLRDVINQIKTDLGPFIYDFKLIAKIVSTMFTRSLDKILNNGSIEKVLLSFRNIITTIALLLNEVGKAFKEVFPNSKGFLDTFYKFTKALIPSKEALEGFREVMKTLFVVLRIGAIIFGNVIKLVASLILYINKWIQELLVLGKEFKQFLDPFIKWVNETKLVERIIFSIVGIIATFVEKVIEIKDAFILLVETNTKLKEFFTNIFRGITNLATGLYALISSLDLTTAGVVTLAVAMVFIGEFIYQKLILGFRFFTTILYNTTRLISNFANIFGSINSIFRSINRTIEWGLVDLIAAAILKLAVSIGVLTASIKVLSEIEIGKLLKAGGALVVLFGLLIGSYLLLYKVSKDAPIFKLGSMALVLLSLSYAIFVLSVSMKLLSTIDGNGLLSGIIGLSVIAAILVGISKNAEAINTKGFITLGLAFVLLSFAVTNIASIAMKDTGAIHTAMDALVGLTAIIAAMMWISDYLSSSKGISSKGFILFALAIDLLALAVSKVGKIAIQDNSAVGTAVEAIASMAVLIVAMMFVEEILLKSSKGISAKGFVWFALSIDLLAAAIASVAKIAVSDQAAVLEAVGAIYSLTILVAAMMAFSRVFNKTKGIKSSGFISFAISIDLLSAAIVSIAKMASVDPMSIDNAYDCILGLTILAGAMMVLTAYLNKSLLIKGIKSNGFITFAIAIWILSQAVVSVAKMASVNPAALEKAEQAMVVLTAIVVVMMALSTKLKGIKSSGFVELSATLLIMSWSMNILAKTFGDEDGIHKLNKAGIAMVYMIGIIGMMMVISKNSDYLKARGMIAMAGSILVLASSMAIISLLDYGKIIAASVAIAGMAVALSWASRLMSQNILKPTGFAIAAASIILLASALYILKDVDVDALERITICLIGISVVVSIISDGLMNSKFSAGIAGFAIIAAGILLLSSALKQLADVPISQLIGVAAVLTGLTVVFGLLGLAASNNVVATGLVILAASLLGLSASAFVFAASVSILLSSISEFINNLLALKDVSTEAINNVLANIETLADGITALAPKITSAMTAIIGSVGGAILNAAPIIALAGASIIMYLIMGILKMIPSLLDSFSMCITTIDQWTEQHGEELYNAGYNVGYKIMKGMFAALEGASYAFAEYLSEDLLPQWGVKTNSVKMKEYAEQFAENWRASFFDGLKKDDGRSEEAAEAIVRGLNIGLEKGYITYEEASAKLAEIGLEAFKAKLDIHSPSGEMEENGENIVDGLINGVKNKDNLFAEWMEKLANKGIKAFQNKFGSTDLLEGMFNFNEVSDTPSAFDKVEDLSKNGAWAASNHTIHSYIDRWKAEGYESAEAWEAANKEVDPLTKMLEDMAKQMGINTEETEELSEATEKLGNTSSGTNEKLKEFRDGLEKSIGDAMHKIFDEVEEEEIIDPEEMLYRMGENIRRVGEWARNISTLAARGMSEGLLNELKNMGPEGAAKVKAFVEMTDEQLRKANMRWSVAEDMPDYGTKSIEKAYREAGFNASLGFANGIDPNAANDAMLDLSTNSLNSLKSKAGLWEESPSHKTEEIGEYAAIGLANGLTNNKAQSVIRMQSIAISNLLLNTLKNSIKPQQFQEISGNIFDGFSNGMSSKIPQILSKVTSFCGQIINAFQRVLRMHSPSKVMEELGEYTMDGFGIGFEDGAENVEKLSDQAANDILNQMKANIAAITNGWSEDNAYQPVIRPVFDMEALNTGYNDIQSWFANSEGLNLNGNLSRLTPTNTDDSTSNQQIVDAINRINNDDVVREIGALRDDISQLQTAITNMQVVLNTGTLVGQLVEPMDRALGSKALMKNRGRY